MKNDANTLFLEENTTNILEKPAENVSALIDKKFSSLTEYIEKRFYILEDHVIVMQNINLPRNVVNPATLENGLYVDLLKNTISQSEKQLTENAVLVTWKIVCTLASSKIRFQGWKSN